MSRVTLSPERLEAIRAYDRERYVRERERRIAKALAWNAANPEKHRAGIKQWQQDHRELLNERSSEWKRRNPAKNAERNRRRKAQIRGSTLVKFSHADLAARMSMFGNRCWMCGGPFEEVDHVKPIACGGAHILANLRPACGWCNRSKGATWPYDSGR